MWNQINMRNVWALAISQYIVSIVDRVVQIALVVSDLQSQGGRMTLLFLCTSYVRACCTFMVYFALPAIVLERCFATYFLEDYEKKQRPYLGHTITLMMLLNALMCSYTFHEADSTYFHIGCVLVVNSIAIAVNKFNIDTNKRYYYESMQCNRSNTTRIYSLGERYQIAQNIKVCKLCSAPRTHPEFVSVVSTMGYETHVHQQQHAACYFDMLKKDWS
ncbi:unnamed protein product [Cylicocyclus nassatus]|uniref:Uncharacterized protein n=1 Tax=Cylicocyclus nassatus TaxID=53992 RepID=A0AA36MC78_CYLNA|nr:unnamed protein product [Cylicocyclus nassatus]